MSGLIALTEKLNGSYELKNSMAAFIPELLAQYARGELDKDLLRAALLRRNKDAQFYNMHMPREDRLNNLRLFHKEFVFADRLLDLVEAGVPEDDAAFDAALAECMEAYLRSAED